MTDEAPKTDAATAAPAPAPSATAPPRGRARVEAFVGQSNAVLIAPAPAPLAFKPDSWIAHLAQHERRADGSTAPGSVLCSPEMLDRARAAAERQLANPTTSDAFLMALAVLHAGNRGAW